MPSWRDVKNKARSQVHSTFGYEATYTPPNPTLPEQTVPCSVRIHEEMVATGDFDSSGMAERMQSAPHLVFLVSEVSPVTGGSVVVTGEGSYRIEYVYPPEGITVKAEVSRV